MSPGTSAALQRMGGDEQSSGRGMNSAANMRKRLELLNHPDIREKLEQLWTSANTDTKDAIIDGEEYKVMHRKILLALDPTTNPREATRQAAEDWKRDSEGKIGLDRDRFYWTWFELADLVYAASSHGRACELHAASAYFFLSSCLSLSPRRP